MTEMQTQILTDGSISSRSRSKSESNDSSEKLVLAGAFDFDSVVDFSTEVWAVDEVESAGAVWLSGAGIETIDGRNEGGGSGAAIGEAMAEVEERAAGAKVGLEWDIPLSSASEKWKRENN